MDNGSLLFIIIEFCCFKKNNYFYLRPASAYRSELVVSHLTIAVKNGWWEHSECWSDIFQNVLLKSLCGEGSLQSHSTGENSSTLGRLRSKFTLARLDLEDSKTRSCSRCSPMFTDVHRCSHTGNSAPLF